MKEAKINCQKCGGHSTTAWLFAAIFIFIGVCVAEKTNSQPIAAQKDPLATEQLLSATRSNDVKTVKLLLENGADVNAKETNGNTALMSAAWRGYVEIIRLLLEKGADVNAKDTKGITALMCAAAQGHTKAVEILLDKDADINAEATNGWDALMFAEVMDMNQTNMSGLNASELLLEKGTGGINAALMYAANQGDTNGVVLLLDKGADVNAKNNYGDTLLMQVATTGHTNTVELLLDKGADINAKDSFGKTALMSAARFGNVEIIKLLLDKGANVNAKDNLGETALMSAAESGDTNAVEIVLARGADINAVDADGLTALGLVGIEREFGYAAIAQLLRQAGATALSVSGSSFNVAVASGTNTDSSGYVTNVALLTPFTLTNSVGNLITNAVLVKLMPNKFIYKFPSGGGGMARLDSLPKDLQEKFGYNPTNAAAADEADVEKQQAELVEMETERQQAIYQDKVRRTTTYVKSCEMHWVVTVIQNVPDGLLVRCPDDTTALIVDLNKDTVTDDERIEGRFYPYGVYSYESVNGSKKTVRKLTPNLDHAVSYKLTNPN